MNSYKDPILSDVVWGKHWFKAQYVSSTTIRILGRDVRPLFPNLSAIRIIKNGVKVHVHVDTATLNGSDTDLVILDTTFSPGDVISVNPSKLLDNTSLSFRFDHVRVTGSRGVQIRNSNPIAELYETDAASDEKLWRWSANSGILSLQLLTDLSASPISVLSFDRSAATKLTQLQILNTDLLLVNAPTEINTGTSNALKLVNSNNSAWALILRRSDTLEESGIRLRSGPYVEFQHVPHYTTHAIWHAGSFDPTTKANLSGGATFQNGLIIIQGDNIAPFLALNNTGASARNMLEWRRNGAAKWWFSLSATDTLSLLGGTGGTTAFDISLSRVVDFKSNPTVNGNSLWHAGNDGTGSGLDADLLDGQHASAFSLTGHTHDDRYFTEGEVTTLLAAKVAKAGDTMTGALTINMANAGKLFLQAVDASGDNWIESRDETGTRMWMFNLGDRNQGNRLAIYNQASASYVFYITTGGNGTFTGDLYANKHITTSTRELKKDIKYIDGYDLSVLDLELASFRWKKKHSSNQELQIGLIVEDTVEKCRPIVVFDEDGKPRGIDYGLLALKLQPHVKRHHDLLEQYEETIKTLESRIHNLEQQLS